MTRPRLDQRVQAAGYVNTCTEYRRKKIALSCQIMSVCSEEYFEIGHDLSLFHLSQSSFISRYTIFAVDSASLTYEWINRTLWQESTNMHKRQDLTVRLPIFAGMARTACFPSHLLTHYMLCIWHTNIFLGIYDTIWKTHTKIYMFPLIKTEWGKSRT
jgi:hypothetical protein